ncbi:hypothetical protein ACLI1A_12050 [Flavobacterium sp. RHBU_3]|uniref:hypothetical protein n=1 Tax=Flavobacterium sp. RHBU_3 TaxID=3391184 RepID=UPI0039850CEC
MPLAPMGAASCEPVGLADTADSGYEGNEMALCGLLMEMKKPRECMAFRYFVKVFFY